MNTLQLQFQMLIFAGWVNRSQQDVIECLQEENRGLREQLGGKCLLFTDGQCRRLAAKEIGRKGIFEIGALVTPDPSSATVRLCAICFIPYGMEGDRSGVSGSFDPNV